MITVKSPQQYTTVNDFDKLWTKKVQFFISTDAHDNVIMEMRRGQSLTGRLKPSQAQYCQPHSHTFMQRHTNTPKDLHF